MDEEYEGIPRGRGCDSGPGEGVGTSESHKESVVTSITGKVRVSHPWGSLVGTRRERARGVSQVRDVVSVLLTPGVRRRRRCDYVSRWGRCPGIPLLAGVLEVYMSISGSWFVSRSCLICKLWKVIIQEASSTVSHYYFGRNNCSINQLLGK